MLFIGNPFTVRLSCLPWRRLVLTEQAWSIKNLLYSFQAGKFSSGTRRVVPSGQDTSILPAHGATINKTIIKRYVLLEPNPDFTRAQQGSILGPLLFITYLNDVHKPLQSSRIITYADDTVIFTSSNNLDIIERSLNDDVNNLATCFRKNELLDHKTQKWEHRNGDLRDYKKVGLILASFFFCQFMDLDFVSVHKHKQEKMNLANIQPSYPDTWSITHAY